MSDTEQPQEQQLPTIPHDVILDVLSRLPAKTLLRFRCVCKSWNSLTRDKNFTELHLKRATTDPSQKRVLLSVKPFWSIQYDNLDDFVKNRCNVIIRKDTPSALACLGSNKDFEIIGECNGLICIALRKPRKRSHHYRDPIERIFCLWNPSTGEGWEITRNDVANDKVVTRSMFSAACGHYNRFEVFRFGYDSTVDDYKIVRLVSHWSDNGVMQVEIFTVGRRTWMKKEVTREFDGFISMNTLNCSFLNGSFHWVMEKKIGEMLIRSFDLEKERVKEVIPLPHFSENRLVYAGRMSVAGGKLMLVTQLEDATTEIWVMDEYGVGTSWAKLVTLCKVPDVKFGNSLSPVCFSRNGGVLVCVNGYHYMMYDPRDKTYRRSHHLPLRNRPHMSVYVESLISPVRGSNAVG
uniref:F-box domain-containing protein n=1 Tax=Kalanchoe fedtschenkoi TaxID=63787 RepID=A0A7N0UIC4_KALFE